MSFTPAARSIEAIVAELSAHRPFGQMAPDAVATFVAASRQTRFAQGETVLQPSDGPARHLFLLQRGTVIARRGGTDPDGGTFHIEAGDLFPVGAVLNERPVMARYEALQECVCLKVPAEVVNQLARTSAAWADHLSLRVQETLALSLRALQAEQASHALAEQSLEAPLSDLPRKPPVACRADTPLADALMQMHASRVGSVLVLDEGGSALGILTRHDVLERVALQRPPDDSPVSHVMSSPVHTLDIGACAQDAALLMSRHGIRHLPLTERGRVTSIVSERDLFSLQRLSPRHISSRIRAAADQVAVMQAADEIRRFARLLMAQGLSAHSLTRLISHLNDRLTERLVALTAAAHGLDLHRACWLAFGSEGRSEQTIATDQDNGLVFESDNADVDRPAWLAMARDVNAALNACGYPLCPGNVMASNPLCCLTADEWIARFDHWMEHGAPEDLLNASIYFDFRALTGADGLARPMRDFVRRRARQLPRFMKQMADNALRNRPPLNWHGGLEAQRDARGDWIDLKLHGTTIFVDTARLYALAHGIDETSTRGRLQALAEPLREAAPVVQGWIGAFESLQTLRLRAQVERRSAPAGESAAGDGTGNPNRIALASLSTIDHRLLKESFRIARTLQQRLALDYQR